MFNSVCIYGARRHFYLIRHLKKHKIVYILIHFDQFFPTCELAIPNYALDIKIE